MTRARRCWETLVTRGVAALVAATSAACAPSSAGLPRTPSVADDSAAAARRLAEFARLESESFDWIAAADPRLAQRAHATASDDVLGRVGTQAVLSEDATAQIRIGSLDLFAFRGRARALDEAAKLVASSVGELPDVALEGTLTRPRLERELLSRLVEEERTRATDEGMLGDASGDLVRGILATWTPPQVPQDWPERDGWVSKHLLEIRDSLRSDRRVSGPLDVDVALYPLERLLAPLQFPKGAAAIAEVRVALDADPRAAPPLVAPERMAHSILVHLGLKVEPGALSARLAKVEAELREVAERALADAGPARATALVRARSLLLSEAPCGEVTGTRVRAMAPPPERAAVCGAVRALAEEPQPASALAALHDDVVFAMAAITTSPPPRTHLLSTPDDDVVDALKREARERPVVPLGVAFAAEIVLAGTHPDARARAWHALGEAPLDVAAREIDAATARAP
jgi:hypothetical protein